MRIKLGGTGRALFTPLSNSKAPLSHVPSAPLIVPIGLRLKGDGKDFPAVVAVFKAKLRFG